MFSCVPYPAVRRATALLLAALACQGAGAAALSLSDPALIIDGAWFAERRGGCIVLARHAAKVLADADAGLSAASRPYALTQAGVVLRFRTDSPRVRLQFVRHAGGAAISLRQGFEIRIDGQPAQLAEQLEFDLAAPAPGVHEYSISLPSYFAVDLCGITLDNGHQLAPPTLDHRPVLVAIGDSNTNGLGQQSASHLGYPAVLARRRAWRLVNLGVSGAAIGPALAQELRGQRADIITVALGFNDWYWHAGSLARTSERYGVLLDRLRAAQPQALIVAITPLVSTADAGRALAPYSLEQLRAAMTAAVMARRAAGDQRMLVVAGDTLSDPAMLLDGIHLSVEGAASYARALDAVLPDPRIRTSLSD